MSAAASVRAIRSSPGWREPTLVRPGKGREAFRRASVPSPLLVGVGQAEEHPLGPWPSKKLEPSWQDRLGPAVRSEAHGHRDRWHPCSRCNPLRVVPAVLLVGTVQVSRRIQPGRVDQGVHTSRIHLGDHGGKERLPARVLNEVRAGSLPFRWVHIGGAFSRTISDRPPTTGGRLRSPALRQRPGWGQSHPRC